MEQNLSALSPQNILTALLVILVVIWIAKQLMDFVLTLRNLRKPQDQEHRNLTEHQEACGRRFDADKRRLDKLESRMDSVEEGQRVLCKGVYEVIEHMLHNGNEGEMRQASKDIFNYLNS